MADHNEEVLRRSLDAVDRNRNWLLIGLAIYFTFGQKHSTLREAK